MCCLKDCKRDNAAARNTLSGANSGSERMRVISMAVALGLALAGPALAASTSAKMTGGFSTARCTCHAAEPSRRIGGPVSAAADQIVLGGSGIKQTAQPRLTQN